ncbi:MAG: hypothetical protein ACI8QC_003174 [Planctomycetota bacterium]
MCTVSWQHRAPAESSTVPAGYDLFFNRDESRVRGPERPPEQISEQGVQYLAPADSDAGGTWVSVNEFGLSVGLLNGYTASKGAIRESYISRGQLVRELSGLRSPAEVMTNMTSERLADYRPLVLFAIGPDGDAKLLRWDGLCLVLIDQAEAQLPLSSSGYDQQAARERRAQLLRAARARHPQDPAAALLDFHTGAGVPPDATSACMSREDAETRSLVHIAVSTQEVNLAYAGGRPDLTALQEPLHLARRES